MNEYNDHGIQAEAASGEVPPQYQYYPMNMPRYEKPRRKKKSRFLVTMLVVLIFLMIGCTLGAGGILIGMNIQPKAEEPEPTENLTTIVEGLRETSKIQVAQIDTSKEMTPAEVYAANVQSTVGITTSTNVNYWGFKSTTAASGSGFIISDDGYILTNHHVIEDSDSITVALYDGTAYDAKLIGFDESNDIAVLKVDAEGLPPVILGDSDNLNVGDSVIAIGNPLGELTFSLTVGYVSAMDRQVTLSSNVTMNLIQTDAAINSGNSGGALFNLYGEVIGVTNAKYSSSSSSEASIDNIGFAIPMNSIRSIVESIIEKGYVAKPYIGVTVGNVSSDYQLYGLPQGAAIQSVTEGGPAALGGLAAGDIITSANSTQISSSDDLVKLVQASVPGDVLNLTVYRQGETVELAVTVDEQRQDALGQEETQQQAQQPQQQSPQGGFPFGFRP